MDSPDTMTASEKLYQLIQNFSENQITEVLHFAEFLHQKQLAAPIPAISPRLQGMAPRADAIQKMRGLLQTDQPAPTDQDVTDMLAERRLEKYLP